MVDCSIGTPYDPPLPAVIEALASSGTERGYPASAGSAGAARGRGVVVDPPLRARRPSRRRPSPPAWGRRSWWPRCRICSGSAARTGTRCCTPRCPIPPTPWGRSWPGVAPSRSRPVRDASADSISTPSSPDDGARALLLWSNSPSNPTGGLGDLGAEAAWGRAHGVPVFSDECYAEFTWDGPPRSVLQHGSDGVVAVHSLSKRSNLAGVRVGFYAGDPELVEFLRAVRQHAGLMVPGPAQAAGVAALSDDAHVEAQRARYRERLAFLAGVLGGYGCPVALPEGGFYLWVPGARRPLARRLGSWPRRWPPTAGSWSAPAISTATTARDTCGWRSSSRWSGWRWWGSASLRCGMADLQASIEELWERRAELSPADTDAASAGRGGHRAARHGPGPRGRGRRRHRRGGRPRVAQEVDPDALLAARHGDDRDRALRVRRQASAQARLRRGRRARPAGRLGPLGLVPRPRRRAHAVLREHRCLGRGRTPWSTPGPPWPPAPRSASASTWRAASASAACSSRRTPCPWSSRTTPSSGAAAW